MKKRKQRDERKKTGHRQKREYKSNTKERASGNILTQNRIYEGHPRPQDGTPIYPSTTYCGNAKKLSTRERTLT
jgi:hypothetical protein